MSLGKLLKNRAPCKANIRLPVSVLTEGNTRLELFTLVSFSCLWRLKYCLNCSDERSLKHLKMSIATRLLLTSSIVSQNSIGSRGLIIYAALFG